MPTNMGTQIKKYKDMSRLYKYDLQIPLPSKVDRGRKECKKGKRQDKSINGLLKRKIAVANKVVKQLKAKLEDFLFMLGPCCAETFPAWPAVITEGISPAHDSMQI